MKYKSKPVKKAVQIFINVKLLSGINSYLEEMYSQCPTLLHLSHDGVCWILPLRLAGFRAVSLKGNLSCLYPSHAHTFLHFKVTQLLSNGKQIG